MAYGVLNNFSSVTMRILHIIPTVDPRAGGSAIACVELCKALAAKGMEVVVYTTTIGRPLAMVSSNGGRVMSDGVEYRYFRIWGYDRYWISLSMFRAIRENIQSFDIVHIHSLYRSHLPVTVFYCRKFGIPYILKPHGSLDPYLFVRRRWRKWLHEVWVERPALAGAAAIHFTSLEEQRLAGTTSVFRRGRNYANVVVPSGVVIPEGMSVKEGTPQRLADASHEERKDIILFLGRITVKKGLDILCRAFGAVAKVKEGAHLVIAGPDDEGYGRQVRQWLKEEGVLDRTTFKGMLLGREKEDMYRAATVFVLPSYTENFGITILESLNAGVPVVISNKVNIWREIEQAGAGIVVNCNADETAKAILDLLEDPLLRKEMGARGAGLVKNHFSWEYAADQTLKVYEKLSRPKGCSLTSVNVPQVSENRS